MTHTTVLKRKDPLVSLLALLPILFFPALSFADTFCVSTAGELQSALTTATANGEDDVIQVVQGLYEGNFIYASTEAFGLSVEGGYVAGCSSWVVDSANTVLDGMSTGTVLALSTTPNGDFALTVDGLTLQNGVATHEQGGGLFASTKGQITLNNNTISNNTGAYGGGVYVASTSEITIIMNNNAISNNSGGWGGGVYISSYRSSVILANNAFRNNTAWGGGGVYVSSADALTLTNNTISDNTGGASLGGGIYVRSAPAVTMTNNTVTNNDAGSGGGICLELYSDNDHANIFNNIILGNSAGKGADLYIDNDSNQNFFPSSVNLFHNDFDQSAAGIFTSLPFSIDPSNLDNLDPVFVDPASGDYHLQDGSPVIDMGDNSAPEIPAADKDGLPRIINGVVDMGAFEFVPEGLDRPVADAGGPYEGSVGETLTFDGGNSSDLDGQIETWEWDFGDGSLPGSGEVVTHTYDAVGTYTVVLTVTDNDGYSATDTTTSQIRIAPVAEAGGPYAGLVGATLTFDGSGSSDADGIIEIWEWNFGDGSPPQFGETVTHTYDVPGIHTVTLTVTGNHGLSGTDVTTADIRALPVADAGGPYVGLVGETLTFDGSASSDADGTIESWEWNFGDGSPTEYEPIVTHSYDASGFYPVTLTVTDDDGFSDLDLTTATINSLPFANDMFASRVLLSGNSGQTTGTNLQATREAGEPNHADAWGGASVWWKWVAPARGDVTFDTHGSNFDTLLAVYTGSSVDSLTEIASNDDDKSPNFNSGLSFVAQAGVEYQVAVDGFGGAAGEIVLNWNLDPVPVNDNFIDRILLSGISGEVTGTNERATREPGEPDHAGYWGNGSVWWKWVAPATGSATFDAQGGTFLTLLGIYTGSSVDNLTVVASDASPNYTSASFTAHSGVEYQIAVDGSNIYVINNNIVLNWSLSPGVFNDDFIDRIEISGSSGQTTGTNVEASQESGEPDHAGRVGGASVWWKWIAPATDEVTFDTHGSNFDTLFAVYTGSSVDSLTEIASNDDDKSPNYNSGLSFTAQSGVEYLIAVDGYLGASGDFVLNWSSAAVSNDELALDLGSAGLRHYRDGNEAQLSHWDPEGLLGWENKLVVAFGSGLGTYIYDSTGSKKVSGWSPYDIAAWGDKLAAAFDAQGLWVYDTNSWSKLTGWQPEQMVGLGNNLAADFGSGRGLWVYDSSVWSKISAWDPLDMVTWGDKLVAAFDSGRGLWLHEAGGWRKLTNWEPEQVISWGDKLVVDFGSPRGLWLYESSGWAKISGWDCYEIVAWGNKLAVAFDSGRGLWLYDWAGWTKLTGWEPVELEALRNELVAAFGSGRGIWAYETDWNKIMSSDSEKIEGVNIF